MTFTLSSLHHYPIKGLSGASLDGVSLVPGQGFPLDRSFGFARPGSGFDPANPAPLPKTKFVVLARDPRLALVSSQYDAEAGTLLLNTPERRGVFDITSEAGCDEAAAFVAAHLGLKADEVPTLYSASPHRFTDVSVVSPQMMNAVSLINLDSVAAFGDEIGAKVDPARFRGNITFSGAASHSELDWVGRTLEIGDVRLKVVKRTKRCAATQVNLQTGMCDLDVPALLHAQLGHMDMGIYAEVVHGGQIAPGDVMRLSPD